MFRTSSVLQIKASLAANGGSIGKRDNAELRIGIRRLSMAYMDTG